MSWGTGIDHFEGLHSFINSRSLPHNWMHTCLCDRNKLAQTSWIIDADTAYQFILFFFTLFLTSSQIYKKLKKIVTLLQKPLHKYSYPYEYPDDAFHSFLCLDSVIYLSVNGTVTNLPVFIQNISNCVPKMNKAFIIIISFFYETI